MDIRTLQYFVAVADLLSFSQAAKSLFVSQSTLSQTILDLEEELGVQLLERKNRTTSLTEAGKVMLTGAKELLYRSEQLKDNVRNARDKNYQNSSLTIGYSVNHIDNTPLRHVICRSVSEIRRQYPGIAVTLRQYEVGDLQKELLSGSMDLCLASGHQEFSSQNLIRTDIWEEELVLAFHRDYPCPEDRNGLQQFLLEHPVHLLSQNIDALAYIMGIFSELEAVPAIRFYENSFDMLLAAESGECLLILPQSAYDRLNSMDLACCGFMGTKAILRTALVRKERMQNPMAAAFCSVMEKELAFFRAGSAAAEADETCRPVHPEGRP